MLTRLTHAQASDPNYSDGIFIQNPTINSHRSNPDVAPAYEVPGREYITSFDPATGLHLNTFPADEAQEITDKINRAAYAQKEWEKTTFADRRRVVRSLKKWLVENQDVCAQTACRDTGKTRTSHLLLSCWLCDEICSVFFVVIDAALGEILTTCSKMDWLIDHGEKYLKPESRSSPFMQIYKKSQVHYEPMGVVAAIVSWNYRMSPAIFFFVFSSFSSIFSITQCLVTYPGCYICWERRRLEMFGAGDLVDDLVHWCDS